MFDFLEYVKRDPFAKIKYVANEVRLTHKDLASILDLSLGEINSFFVKKKTIDISCQSKLSEKLYLLMSLFSYLLKLADYDSAQLARLWNDSSIIYESALNQPPWYPIGLKNYLAKHKSQGLSSCVKWIKEYKNAGDSVGQRLTSRSN